MKPIMMIKDSEKKQDVKDMLEVQGYGFTTRGLHRYQKEHGLPVTSFISEFEANHILGEN